MIRILGLIRLTLLIRILIDPVISFITDFQIRRGVLELFHIKGRRVGADSRNKIFQKSASEENSSSANVGGQSTKDVPEQPRSQSVKTVA
uniref:RDD domain-containing protein n=1 Tax=Steinernema glaseri TaxID=37863 RepID=A0A1I8AF33_9BILA